MTIPPTSPLVKRQPLVDQVLGYLRQQIAAGVFPVGSKLPSEPELMTLLAIGRSTLREAMRVLAHMGLVDVRPGDGTYICAPPPEMESLGQRLQRAQVFEVYEVRRTLELECVRLAALRRDEKDIALLLKTLQERSALFAPGSEQAFISADLTFHLLIARATKNPVLADIYQAFIDVHRESWVKASEVPGSDKLGQTLHEQLADAIVQRDPELAQQLMKLLLEQSTERFQQVLCNESQI